MPPLCVQAVFRDCFVRWGLPARLRVDNGSPWGSSGDLPPDLSLWLWGLGLDVHWNRPSRPQENGVVERSQGTAKNWAEPSACTSVDELQQALDRMDRIQRERYPFEGELSRLQAWPALSHSGRPYTRRWERRAWNFGRVLDRLSAYAVTRRVDKNGRITFYNRSRYVGTIHCGRTVYVMLDPDAIEWVLADQEGHQVRRLAAKELTKSNIQNLTVARHAPGTRQKRRAAKLSCPN